METRKSASQVKTGKCINARRTSSEALAQGTGLCSLLDSTPLPGSQCGCLDERILKIM